jgi:hypothetical protein
MDEPEDHGAAGGAHYALRAEGPAGVPCAERDGAPSSQRPER